MSWQARMSIAWGSGPAEIPAVSVAAPAFSFALEPAGRVPAVPRLRLRGEAVALLNLDEREAGDSDHLQILILPGGDTARARRVSVPQTGARVLDFALDDQGRLIQLLARKHGDEITAAIVCTSPAGELVWRNERENRAARLLVDDVGHLYLLDDAARELTALDPATGRSEARFVQPAGFHKAIITPDGTVISQTYDADARRRGMVALNPVTGSTKSMVGDKSLYGWLLYPIGADGAEQIYLFRPGKRAQPPAVGMIRFDGTIVAVRELGDAPWESEPALRAAPYTTWQVAANGRIWIPTADDNGIHLFDLSPAD